MILKALGLGTKSLTIGRAGSFGLGAAVAVVGAIIARPLIVEAMRGGYAATDAVKGAWDQAKVEAGRVKQEALAGREADQMESELQQLRNEVASLRAQLPPS